MNKDDLLKKQKFIEEYTKASNAATGSEFDSNANVSSKNIATLETELSKKDFIDINRFTIKNYLSKMYNEDIATQFDYDIKNHIIYVNDETSLKPYCCSVSLYPFLLNGLQDLGGTASAPKHAESYIGGIINLIYLLASQFAGAIGIPEFLTYFDHFLRIDYGQYYIEHLDDTIENFGNKKLTLRKKVEDWFQQFIYSINQPAGSRNYQSPFINISYFDKYYFESIFKDFFFPDGDIPNWESTKELQKIFMKWFNKEREKTTITFPVESANILVDKETKNYKDEEMADFFAEMWAEGHSFFMYQSDSADALSSCCRLRNAVDDNVFSYTLGAGGIKTGSKKVITLNLNRIVQNWYKQEKTTLLSDYIRNIVKNVHKYLNAWNQKLWNNYNDNMLPAYKAGFIELDKQYLTVGVNGFVEAAEFLGLQKDTKYNDIKTDPNNKQYREFAHDILGTIKEVNKEDKDEHHKYNLELIPAENAAGKLYNWDKKAGYWVPSSRNLYNSYFYVVEDKTIDPVSKFYYQGKGFASECDGGVALHCNLDSYLSKAQYRHLMDVAVKAGCNYFTYNIPNTICNDCGFRSKNYYHKCPKCGSENLDYETRIIGYLRRISNFSEIRQIEANRRAYYCFNKGASVDDNQLKS